MARSETQDQQKPDTSYAEPAYAKSGKPKTDYPWYLPNIDKHLDPKMKELLKTYSKIPPERQSEHVHTIRDQAWAIRAYPCTGVGVWLKPYISHSPAYPRILSRLQSGATFMDIGCFLGGDSRWLAFDGAPTDKMYGVDIVSHWEIGYALFNDQNHFRGHFIESDVLSPDNADLKKLERKMDVISISAVLHQWVWTRQVEAAKRVVEFSSGPGAMIVGHQIGNVEGKEVVLKAVGVPAWRHNPESFAKMWNQVGEETGTKWDTEARLLSWEEIDWDPNDHKWMEEGDCVIDFVVTRVQ